MHENDAEIVAIEARVVDQDAVRKIVQRPQLHARESAACDHEREQASSNLGSDSRSARSNISITRLRMRIASSRILKSKAGVRRSETEIVRDGSQREDELVVGNFAPRLARFAAAEDYAASGEIDLGRHCRG